MPPQASPGAMTPYIRLIDDRETVMFLRSITEALADPARMLLQL